MKRVLSDVHPGQIWRDRDKRMVSGNRRVRVMFCKRDGDVVTVVYSPVDYHGRVFDQFFRSRYDRFQRAFDLVSASQERP